MADLNIISLRGGMNNTDPSISLPDDQCVLAENVEFHNSLLGERRLGTAAITLPASISAHDKVPFLFRHLPTADQTASELWALGVTGTSTSTLSKKTTSWTDVTMSDTPDLTDGYPYRWQAVTLHGKMFLAYKSAVDRLHVYDGTSLRRTGLAEPAAAPTAANAGVGTISGTRYYRVRFIVTSGTQVLLRSEPSDVLTFTPSGSGASITITRPAAISEGETGWELEASLDNANFYVVTTIAIATTTYSDTATFNNGYSSLTLSPDIGDYALIHSPRYLTVDGDRLIYGGSYEDPTLGSRVGWTPVYGASGSGNDERLETDTDPYQDLDTYENGELTGLSPTVLGSIWAFKQEAIYKMVRSGKRTAAYNSVKYTDTVGAIHGSVVTAVDETGQPAIYFIDHDQGPCRLGYGGIKRCGDDIRKTWERLNVDASAVVTSCMYFGKKKQVHWCIAVDGDSTPSIRLVLHTALSRPFADGTRKGWSIWTGTAATALTMINYADNIESNTARSLKLVPFIGLSGNGLVHKGDTGYTDNGTTYTATITTKPYWLGGLLHKFTVHSASLLAKAVSGALITLKVIRDFALETTSTVTDINLSASASETDVIKALDSLTGAELTVAQFQFTDTTTPTAAFELNRLDIRESNGQNA